MLELFTVWKVYHEGLQSQIEVHIALGIRLDLLAIGYFVEIVLSPKA